MPDNMLLDASSDTYSSQPLHNPMVLGTVQLGMSYGAANRTGQPSEADAIAIVQAAVAQGITHLDCAQAYGCSEERLGKALIQQAYSPPVTVITKLDPLQDLLPETPLPQVLETVDMLMDRSCRRLKTSRLDALLLHRWQHHGAYNGHLWHHLCQQLESGRIGALGVSVQSPDEMLAALADPLITLIQLPFNLLDWRWKMAGIPDALKKRPDSIIYARSVLLQGVLPAEARYWPVISSGPEALNLKMLNYPENWIKQLQQLAEELERESISDLCFAYVRGQSWIHHVVVGVETLAQLTQNIRLFKKLPLTIEEICHVDETITKAPEALLNPAYWLSR